MNHFTDSIHFWNIKDTIKGNISTNGTIQLLPNHQADNKIQGNIIGNNRKGTIWTDSNYTLQGSNNSVSYADPYEIDYKKNTTDSSMVAIKEYIDGIISSAKTGTASDGSNEYTNSSTGGQIFYNDDASYLTFTMEKSFTVNNINMPMFTTGDGSSGYNIIIAKGNINASTTISNENYPTIIISLNGNISFENTATDKDVPFYGILYAPNGTIDIQGGTTENTRKLKYDFYGSMVAQKINIRTLRQDINYESFSDYAGGTTSSTETTTGTISLIN